jgi:glycosyltransferase involved in cell wall biosynthesis
MSSKRTIAIVTPYFTPHGGGLEHYAHEIAKRLQENHGWRVIVITSGERYGSDIKEELDGLTVYRLSYNIKFSNTPLSFGWFKKIKNIFDAENPDIINIHAPVPGIGDIAAFLNSKKPVVLTYHGASMHKGKLWQDIFIWFYEHGPLQNLLDKAKYIICSSDFIQFEFLQKYLYKSIAITPGVDFDFFKPDIQKKTKDFTVLFVAGLSRAEQHKGLKTLIDALAISRKTIPNIHLMVVGSGNMIDEYKAYADQLQLTDAITFRGRLGGQELINAYQEAHVFALPTSNDSSPMVLLEAMAAELPVISTKIGGIPLIIQDNKNGFLIEPDQPEVLAEKFNELFSDPDKVNIFGQNGRAEMIDRFGWQGRTKDYSRILSESLEKPKDRQPRVAVVTPYFYPKVGGLENYALEMARALKAAGNDVFIITSNHLGKGSRYDKVDGMRVYRLPILFKISNTPIHPLWYIWIRRILKKEQPDIINAHTPVPFIADMTERARGHIPFVLTYHSDIIKSSPILNFLSKLEYIFLTNRTLRRADRIIVTSDYYARQSSYLRPLYHKINFVAPGVDIERLKPGVPTPYFNDKFKGSRTVLFVGQLDASHAHKGLDDALMAIAKIKESIPNVKLVIVGRGNHIDHYRSRVSALKITDNVSFEGFVENRLITEYFAGADLLVLPSRDKAEGFGMVIIEAAAVGTPAVATTVGGIPAAIVDGVTGLLVPPSNVDELAKAIKKILEDPALTKKLGDNASERIKNDFSWKKVTDEFLSVMTDAMKHKTPIAQIASYYPPHLGGAEVVVREISLELAEQNYPVTVFTSNIGTGKKEFEDKFNYQVKHIKSSEFSNLPILWSLPFRLLFLPKGTILHVHIAQAGAPEIAMMVAKLRGFPYVAHFHLDVRPSGYFGRVFLFYKKHILSRVLKNADRIIVLSDEQAKLVKEKYYIKESNIVVIPNGVGEKFFNDKKKDALESPLKILYVGRLAVQKHPERLVEAMALLKIPGHLTLVGDGEDREKLEELTKTLKLTNITFAGKKFGDQLLPYYREADVFAIASEIEGMPLVILEAMAAGLPIIGSNVPGIRELVAGTGILVDSPYPETFADAFAKLGNDPQLLKKLSTQSVEKAKQYSWKKLIERLISVYNEVAH